MTTTRITATTLCLLFGASGCTESPAPRAADAPDLLRVANRLQSDEVVAADEGPWRVRRIARPTATTKDSADAIPVTGVATAERTLGAAPPEGAPSGTVAAAEPYREILGGDGGPLRAGATDDNADHAAFLRFLAEQRKELAGSCEWPDVADRRTVRVVDRDGKPLPAATIAFIDEGRDLVVWRATTYGDGRAPFFPGETPKGKPARPASNTWLLEVRHGAHFLRQHWNGKGEEFVVKMPGVAAPKAEVKCDVVFVIDTTGSMGDEIARIKATLQTMTAKLKNLDREFDLRYGAVLYRDINDQYITKQHPFTDKLDAFDKALQAIVADGGGDTPESMNQGLAVAVGDMAWRDGAAKIAFVIADAPPHVDYENDVPYTESLQAAVARGIRIHTVAASGLDKAGTVVFRQVAHFTRGKFVFIEYGGAAATAKEHGVTGKVESNNLDDILYKQIAEEIARWGRAD